MNEKEHPFVKMAKGVYHMQKASDPASIYTSLKSQTALQYR